MSIVQPLSFTQFVESGFMALMAAPTWDTFDAAFNDVFDDNVLITLNGMSLSRDTYEEHFWENKELAPGNVVSIDFQGAVQYPQQNGNTSVTVSQRRADERRWKT